MIIEAHKPISDMKSRLSRFDRVDSTVASSWQTSADDIFHRFGFERVGHGKYAAVYSKPSYPYVIKFFMRDTAYLYWLKFCMANQHNKYVPKIKGRVVKVGNLFMAVRLEKLVEGTTANHMANLQDLLWMALDPEDHLESSAAKSQDEIDLCNEIIKHSRLKDVHSGNLLVRPSTGQAVLIDPYYNWYKQRFTIDPDDLTDLKSVF